MPFDTDTFTNNVRRYCQWVESTPHDIESARQLLMVLMDGAPNLIVSGSREGEEELPAQRRDERQADYLRFSDFAFQYYPVVYMQHDRDEEGPFKEDIHRDLADIYGDLSHGLQALDRGDEVYAARYWRESYFRHWGHHASAAVWAIGWHHEKIRNEKFRNGEQDAAPNGGPATPLGNSGVPEGPPSVS